MPHPNAAMAAMSMTSRPTANLYQQATAAGAAVAGYGLPPGAFNMAAAATGSQACGAMSGGGGGVTNGADAAAADDWYTRQLALRMPAAAAANHALGQSMLHYQ